MIARTNTYEADSPGYFDDGAEARANPSGSADFSNLDGGDKTTNHLSLHFDKEFYDSVKLSVKGYYQTFERERFVRFLESSNLQNRFDDQTISGVRATLDWAINDSWVINSGIDYEFQDVLEQRNSTLNNDTRELDALTRDREFDLGVLGGFVSVEHTPNEYIRWNAGLRLDSLDGDFVDRLANDAGSVHDFGVIVQPKFNLFITPTDELTFFANYGQTFQNPFGRALFDVVGDRDVAINDGWEVGVKYEVEGFSSRLSLWRQESDDEFANVDGFLTDVGATERLGAELALGWNPIERLNLWGNYSHIFISEITDSEDASVIGNELRSIPDFVFSVGGSYKITDSLTARMHLDGQGDYFVNEANEGGEFGDFVILNAGLDYDTNYGRFTLQVNNLFDSYYEYVFDFNNDGTGLIHSPGDGVNATLSYTLAF